jgi:hypothetical protein
MTNPDTPAEIRYIRIANLDVPVVQSAEQTHSDDVAALADKLRRGEALTPDDITNLAAPRPNGNCWGC